MHTGVPCQKREKHRSAIFAEVDAVCCESSSCFGTYKNLHFFISSNCGFRFYCEPIFCVESVMDCSLLHGMMLEL